MSTGPPALERRLSVNWLGHRRTALRRRPGIAPASWRELWSEANHRPLSQWGDLVQRGEAILPGHTAHPEPDLSTGLGAQDEEWSVSGGGALPPVDLATWFRVPGRPLVSRGLCFSDGSVGMKRAAGLLRGAQGVPMHRWSVVEFPASFLEVSMVLFLTVRGSGGRHCSVPPSPHW